jgi:hypothetical protein
VEDFAQRTHPISSVYASFLREASIFKFLCFDGAITLAGDLDCKGGAERRVASMALFC